MRVLVVDDEAPARERLADLVAGLEDFELAGEASDGREALAMVEKLLPDIVLMDVRMPGIDGIEAARHLAGMAQPPAVIFTTAYDEYTLEAFDAAATGYILKPVRRARLERALRQATRPTRAQLAGLQPDGDRSVRTNICARLGDRMRLIPVEDVLYFRADQKYVSVRHSRGTDLIDEPLKDLAEEFDEDFCRIHRNALVALRHVEAIERDQDGQLVARLRDCDETLPVSRRHATEFRRRVQKT
ncbi:MAG: chemotaxis protein CheY [Gammaproteobacteria bacterium SG8_31]|jgi:two-component system response regulator AlgR|nr:MAG: chemotaxis protein CheY [Gammaproteobacteria bacterium SG8_31]